LKSLRLFYSVLLTSTLLFFTQTAQADTFFKFPPGFLWGTATAAYQVEGGIQNDWSESGLDAGKAADHARRYQEDFEQLEKLGTPAYRLSIEWARLEPAPGQYNRAALEDYRKMLKSLNQRGIQPMVTLFHFTLPPWFAKKGGWTQAENIQDFVKFSTWISHELKEEVNWWYTINEPLVYAFKSYDAGAWPPFQKDRNQALKVIKHLILAHAESYRAIHAQDPIAWVGFAKNITLLEPNWPSNPLDNLMTSFQSYLFNEAFWDAISNGELHFNLPGIEPIEIPFNKALMGSMDFVAFNYYTRYMITAGGEQVTRPGVPVNELNWEIYPSGLLKVLRMANLHAKRLHVPIMISENGLADADDSQRSAFLLQHLKQIWLGLQEGIPVAGYLHWSLMDNFEWADGYEAKFGLLDIERKWRPSAKLYQEIIQQNGFPADWLEKYPLAQH
jgi:beta-glucosidase